MLPVVTIELWGRLVAFSSYSAMMYVAATVTVVMALTIAARRGFPLKKVAVCLLLMMVSLPVGARLWHVVIYAGGDAGLPERLLDGTFGGFSLYGGLVAAVGVGFVSCRLLALDVRRLADVFAPVMGVGIALMRVGCFLSGCCFGKVTDLPWGIEFPFGGSAHVYQIYNGIVFPTSGPLPVHPTQLYELVAALIGAGLAWWVLSRRTVDGAAFLVFIIWFSAFRWLNFYLVAPVTRFSVSDWFYPTLYFGIIMLCVYLLARLWAARNASVRKAYSSARI